MPGKLDAGTGSRNRAPDADEMANCRQYLDEQIEIIRPRVILALGAPAAKSFLGRSFRLPQRGQWFDGPLDIPLMASFHPAYILRQTGGELNAVKRLVWDDLKAVRDASTNRRRRQPRSSSRLTSATFFVPCHPI